MDLASGTDWLWPLVQIVFIDLLLSGDNAIAIALACRDLPPAQRRHAMLLGTGGAVALRVLFATLASLLLRLSWLKIAGGVLLIAIGIELLAGPPAGKRPHEVAVSDRLSRAVLTILGADAVMSLDNAVGLAAVARDSVLLLVIGLLLSIPMLFFASSMIIRWLEREPLLVPAGAALLGWVAGSTLVADPVVAPFLDTQSFGLASLAPALCAVYVVVQGRILRERRAGPAPGPVAAPLAARKPEPEDFAADPGPGRILPGEPRADWRTLLPAPLKRFSGMDLAILGGVAVPFLGLLAMVLYFVWSAIRPH